MDSLTNIIVMYVIPFLLAFAAVTDIMYRRIPNKVVLGLFVLFFPAAWAAGFTWIQILEHLAVFAGFLVLGFLLFLPGWFGSGDGKLMAVCGLWLGWPDALTFVVLTALLGGALVFVQIFAGKLLMEGGILFPRLAEGRLGRILFSRPDSVPYGVALVASSLLVLPLSVWMNMVLTAGS